MIFDLFFPLSSLLYFVFFFFFFLVFWFWVDMFGCRGSWKIMWYGRSYRVFGVHAIVFEPFKFDLLFSDKLRSYFFVMLYLILISFFKQPKMEV
jgi:hypothetical protein